MKIVASNATRSKLAAGRRFPIRALYPGGVLMLDFLLSPPVLPFSFALGLLAGLLILEIAALLLGGTLFGKAAEAGDLDAGMDAGAVGFEPASVPSSLDLSQADMGAVDLSDLDLGASDGAPGVATAQGGSLGAMLGLGKVPFLIWLAAALAGFGLSGYLVQSLAAQVFGASLPAVLAVLPAGFVGVWFARGYGRVLARLIPASESSVRSKAMLNRRRGVVSQGVARQGHPAEIRVQDGFGNLHYIRAQPLDQREQIAAGTEVLVLRVLHGAARGEFRIVPLGDP